MNKNFCDCCGQPVKERRSFMHWNYVRFYADEDLDKYYDICPNCYKEIKNFIEHPLEFQAKMILKLQEEKKHE